MRKAAIVASKGFGDGLLMLIAANFLRHQKYEVSVFNTPLLSFKKNLPYFHIHPSLENEKLLFSYDLIILQNDNSSFLKEIISSRKENLHVFYASYKNSKHEPLTEKDFIFDPDIPMADNIHLSCQKLFSLPLDKNIGLVIDQNLIFKKHSRRVVIHPTSTDEDRNWSKKKYLKLSKKIKDEGFEPVIILSKKESSYISSDICEIKIFDDFSNLSSFLYESGFFIGNESGPSHLASYLNIPSVVIAGNHQRIKLWQPGWRRAKIITPPSYLSKIRFLNMKKNWKRFISVNRAFKAFCEIS
jgi:heptosyltransferase III